MEKISRRKFMAATASAVAVATLPAGIPARASEMLPNKGEMMKLTPYLLFDGKCAEAMHFYQTCLGGSLTLTRVKDTPAKNQMTDAQQEKVLNAHLNTGTMEISASDWLALNETPVRGNTACMFIHDGTREDLHKLFEKLSAGAQVTNPLAPTYFGVYGALNDKFGVRWMFAGEFGKAD